MTFIDSAIVWPNGKIYFFEKDQYVAYDIEREEVDPGYPKSVAKYWPGLEAKRIQGAIVWPTLVDGRQKAYFFSGDHCYSYDIQDNRVDPGGPFPTRVKWSGVLAGPFNDYRVETAIAWPNGRAYFFQQDRYYAFYAATVDGETGREVLPGRVVPNDPPYPWTIQEYWPGLWLNGQPYVAGFVWPKPIEGRMKAYFFQTSTYIRYDIASNRAENGYRPIQGNWKGL